MKLEEPFRTALLQELNCPTGPVRHEGKWVIATEIRDPLEGEFVFTEFGDRIILSQNTGFDPMSYIILTPCELPPRPDAETIKRLTPPGKTMTVNAEPDLESVPFVSTSGMCLVPERFNAEEKLHLHGLRYGVVISDAVPVPVVTNHDEYFRCAEVYIKVTDGLMSEFPSTKVNANIGDKFGYNDAYHKITAGEYEAAKGGKKIEPIEFIAPCAPHSLVIERFNQLVEAVNEMRNK